MATFDDVLKTLSAPLEGFLGVLNDIATELSKTATQIADAGGRASSMLGGVVDDLKDLTVATGLVASQALGPMTAALVKIAAVPIAGTLGVVEDVITELAKTGQQIGTSLAPLGRAIAPAIDDVKDFAAAVGILGKQALAPMISVLGSATAAVGRFLAAGFDKALDSFAAQMKALPGQIGDSLKALASQVATAMKYVVQAAGTALQGSGKVLGDLGSALFGSLTGNVSKALKGTSQAIGAFTNTIAAPGAGLAGGAVGGLAGGYIGGAIGAVGGTLSGALATIPAGGIGAIPGALTGGIGGALAGAGIGGTAGAAITGGSVALIGNAAAGFVGALNAPIAAAQSLVGAFKQVTGAALPFVQAFAPATVFAFNEGLRAVHATLGVAFQPIFQVLQPALYQIAATIMPAMQALRPVVEKVAQVFRSVMVPASQLFADTLQNIKPGLDFLAGVFGLLAEAVNGVILVLRSVVQAFGDFLGKANLKGAMDQLASAVREVIKYFLVFAGHLAKFLGQDAFLGKLVDNINAVLKPEVGPKGFATPAAVNAQTTDILGIGRQLSEKAFVAQGAGAGEPAKDEKAYLADAVKLLEGVNDGTQSIEKTIENAKDDFEKYFGQKFDMALRTLEIFLLARTNDILRALPFR